METKFAPAKRSSYIDVINSNISLDKIPYLDEIFCSLSFIFCILNEDRQIVYTNDILMKTLQVQSLEEVLGKRFGEAINCRFSFEEPGGCGTSEHCRYCGAINSMLQCQRTGVKTTSECRIRRIVKGAENFLDVEVTATPFVHENTNFTIFSLIDITDRKRRAIIEKIFFHDIMNTASGLKGFFEIFESIEKEEQQDFLQMGASLCQQIIDEIGMQRLLTQAENQELMVDKQLIDSESFLHHIASELNFLAVAKGKNIVIAEDLISIKFESDPVLLKRILTNMIKNALEASDEGDKVRLSAIQQPYNRIRFSVHNRKYIPRDIEVQVFMRSFSTKGAQRGLGTYSMKILGEQYLGGEVDFTTSEKEGTTFFITL